MLPSEATDLQLIDQVKQNQNSDSLMELVERHTGIYINMVNRYTYVPKIERDDLLEHKMYNIYNYALKYDPDKNMKFSTWVGQNIKWQCQKLITENQDAGIMVSESELADFLEEEEDVGQAKHREIVDFINSEVDTAENQKFAEIYRMRHTKPGCTWEQIAFKFGISKQAVRMLYLRNLKKIETKIHKEIS